MEKNAGAWYLAELRTNIHQVNICFSINMEFIKLDLKVFENLILTVHIYVYTCMYVLLGRNQQTSVLYTDSLTGKVEKDTL